MSICICLRRFNCFGKGCSLLFLALYNCHDVSVDYLSWRTRCNGEKFHEANMHSSSASNKWQNIIWVYVHACTVMCKILVVRDVIRVFNCKMIPQALIPFVSLIWLMAVDSCAVLVDR